jgi:hypothetical protein
MAHGLRIGRVAHAAGLSRDRGLALPPLAMLERGLGLMPLRGRRSRSESPRS